VVIFYTYNSLMKMARFLVVNVTAVLLLILLLLIIMALVKASFIELK